MQETRPGRQGTDQVRVTQRKIVEAVREKYPDRYVHLIIYGPTQTLPKSFPSYPPNLIVELAPPSVENLRFWKPVALRRRNMRFIDKPPPSPPGFAWIGWKSRGRRR